MDAKAFVTDAAGLTAVGIALLATNAGAMGNAAFWIVVAFAFGWLVGPLITKIDPFWPPSIIADKEADT